MKPPDRHSSSAASPSPRRLPWRTVLSTAPTDLPPAGFARRLQVRMANEDAAAGWEARGVQTLTAVLVGAGLVFSAEPLLGAFANVLDLAGAWVPGVVAGALALASAWAVDLLLRQRGEAKA